MRHADGVLSPCFLTLALFYRGGQRDEDREAKLARVEPNTDPSFSPSALLLTDSFRCCFTSRFMKHPGSSIQSAEMQSVVVREKGCSASSHSLAVNLIPSGIREKRFARRFRQELRVRREKSEKESEREEQCRSEKPESHLFIPMSLRLKIRLHPMFLSCPRPPSPHSRSIFFLSLLLLLLYVSHALARLAQGAMDGCVSPPLCHIIVTAACRVQAEYLVCQSGRGFKLSLFSLK